MIVMGKFIDFILDSVLCEHQIAKLDKLTFTAITARSELAGDLLGYANEDRIHPNTPYYEDLLNRNRRTYIREFTKMYHSSCGNPLERLHILDQVPKSQASLILAAVGIEGIYKLVTDLHYVILTYLDRISRDDYYQLKDLDLDYFSSNSQPWYVHESKPQTLPEQYEYLVPYFAEYKLQRLIGL